MLILSGASDLVSVTVGTASAIDVHASYVENNAGTYTPKRTNTASITGTGATTVIGSPGASKEFNVKNLTIYNEHASQETLITVTHTDGTNAETLISCTLLAGELLVLTRRGQWIHYTANGERYFGATVAATQAEMETGTSTSVAVTPGRQHYHPGHPKCWLNAGTTGNILASYNITSLTDTGTGVVTVTIATDFSSANWSCQSMTERAATALTVANLRTDHVQFGGQAAGTVILECHDRTATTCLLADPTNWHMIGMGDHA